MKLIRHLKAHVSEPVIHRKSIPEESPEEENKPILGGSHWFHNRDHQGLFWP
jgi:hypothetical protein